MKLTGKRPAMFFQPGSDKNGRVITGPRIRIFYPNGKAEWMSVNTEARCFIFEDPPCWLDDEPKPNDMKEALELASNYDRRVGFPKMKFLGEL